MNRHMYPVFVHKSHLAYAREIIIRTDGQDFTA